jgi:transmembrane sensor
MNNLDPTLGEIDVDRLKQAAEWLVRLREPTTTDGELTEWLEWCEAAPENLAAFESVQNLWQSVPKQKPQLLDLPTLDSMRMRDRPTRRFTAWPTWIKSFPASTVALALAASGLGVVGAWLLWGNAEPRYADTRYTGSIGVPLRVNEASVLPDGSHVDLSAGSKLAVKFTGTRRQLSMADGMAYFQVKPDKSRPFVVSAGPLVVTAVGTEFNVRRSGDRVVVTVKEGVVRVDKSDTSAGEGTSTAADGGAASEWSELRASAGYQLVYVAHTGETRLSPTDSSAELAWRDGRLVYEDEPLSVVIANVNQYTTSKVVLSDPAIGQMRFTGTVRLDSIDTWLTALPRAFPISVERGPSQIVLVPVER